MAYLELRDLHRSFGSVVALKGIEVELGEGEFLSLLGPSGCGKTTALRLVAGFDRPDAGRIVVDGRDVTNVSPNKRDMGMVFQAYSLFPNMNARQNVEFGLKIRGKHKGDGRSRVDDLLELVGLGHAVDRYPHQLSGGMQQRVALARALAIEPRVLLLDEPLSALDAHTKSSVRAELQELLASLEIPVLLVTHDFEDAAALADSIGVVVEGRLRQLASAAELVARPVDAFVAAFTGANVFRGRAEPSENGSTRVNLVDGTAITVADVVQGDVVVAVYPWDITIGTTPPHDSALNVVQAPIRTISELGNRVRLTLGSVSAEITAESLQRLGLAVGDTACASFKATGVRVVG